MRNAPVTVCLDDQGNITILYKGKPLNYTVFHQQAKQSEVVQSKQIDQALLNQSKAHKPTPNHPWHNRFATPLPNSRDCPPLGDISTSRN
jgi:hypothetical protein